MKIKELKTPRDQEYKTFCAEEWQKADKKHYGDVKVSPGIILAWAAYQDKKMVGFMKAKFSRGVVYLDDLIIAESLQHQGVGSKLLQHLEKWSKKKLAHKIYLQTGQRFIAEKFYQKNGFNVAAILKNHNLHHNFVIMEKFI